MPKPYVGQLPKVPAAAKCLPKVPALKHSGYVGQMGVTHQGILVPSEHRINGFRQLCTTGLIDAAGVDPYVTYAVLKGLLAGLDNLLVPGFPGW